MIKTLKKQCVQSGMIWAAICIVFAVVFFAIGKFQVFKLIAGPTKIEDGCDLEDYEGKYVEIECYGALTEYMRVTTVYDDGRKTLSSVGYLVIYVDDFENWENETYYGIVMPGTEQKTMDTRMDDFWEFLNDGSDVMKYDKTFKVVGTVREIKSGQESRYWEETIEEWEEALEAEALGVQEYVIDATMIGSAERSDVVTFSVIAAIALVIGLICFLNAELGYDNKYKKFLKNHPNVTETELDMDFQSAVRINKELYKGKRYTYFVNGSKFDIIDNDEVVWIYYYYRGGRNSVSQARVHNKFGKMTYINCSQSVCTEYCTLMEADHNHIITDYSKELEKMYKKQLNEFLELKYNPAKRGEFDNLATETETVDPYADLNQNSDEF